MNHDCPIFKNTNYKINQWFWHMLFLFPFVLILLRLPFQVFSLTNFFLLIIIFHNLSQAYWRDNHFILSMAILPSVLVRLSPSISFAPEFSESYADSLKTLSISFSFDFIENFGWGVYGWVLREIYFIISHWLMRPRMTWLTFSFFSFAFILLLLSWILILQQANN